MFKKRGLRTELMVNLPMISPAPQDFIDSMRDLPKQLCPEEFLPEAHAVLKLVSESSPPEMPLIDVFNMHVNQEGIMTLVFRAQWPARDKVLVAATKTGIDDDYTSADLLDEMQREKTMIFYLNKNAVGENAWSNIPSRHLVTLDKAVFTTMMEKMLKWLIVEVKPERKTEQVAARGDQKWLEKSVEAHSLLMEVFQEYVDAQRAAVRA